MYSRVIMSRIGPACRSLLWLVILATHFATTAAAHPYLGHIAPPPLRMREAPSPVAVMPTATPAPAEESDTEHAGPPAAVNLAPIPIETETEASETDLPPSSASTIPAPPPILQDPLRERVQLEDFLPFFTPPAAAQPASRATYRRE
jgi:hypothetical protein